MKDTVFYTIIDDAHYHACRTDEFIESFKLFHPDIDLIVFREEAIRKTFARFPGMNFMNGKAAFAMQLYDKYETIVNIDADHIIFARMDEILTKDYDVGVVAGCSDFRNGAFSIKSISIAPSGRTLENVEYNVCPQQDYLEAGLISGKKHFWDILQWNNLAHGHNLIHKEQDVLNIIIKFVPFDKVKVFDGHTNPDNPAHKMWYGTASMGREKYAKVKDDQILLHNKVMKTVHFSKLRYPKDHPRSLFSEDVCNFIYSKIIIGRYGPHPCGDLLKSKDGDIYIY